MRQLTMTACLLLALSAPARAEDKPSPVQNPDGPIGTVFVDLGIGKDVVGRWWLEGDGGQETFRAGVSGTTGGGMVGIVGSSRTTLFVGASRATAKYSALPGVTDSLRQRYELWTVRATLRVYLALPGR